MYKLALLLLLMCYSKVLYSQSNAEHISIVMGGSSAFKGALFTVRIDASRDSIKVVYKLNRSVDYKAVSNDSVYKKWLKYTIAPLNVTASQDTVMKALAKCAGVIGKYTSYDKDSLLLDAKTNIAYATLLNRIVATPSDTLENVANHPPRIVHDGTHYGFTIFDGKTSRNLWATSPTQKTFPILYELLDETMEVYRDNKHNTFLDKTKTGGF